MDVQRFSRDIYRISYSHSNHQLQNILVTEMESATTPYTRQHREAEKIIDESGIQFTSLDLMTLCRTLLISILLQ